MRDPSSEPIDEDAFLDDVFERAVERWIAGKSVDAEELAAEHPERIEAVRRMIAVAREVVGNGQEPPPVLPGYDIERRLGQGGMGVVYLARQIAVQGRHVALKVLPGTAAWSARARARFLTECRALSRLQHPNVIAIHDVVNASGTLAYAMEYVEGRSLHHLLASLHGVSPAERAERVQSTFAADLAVPCESDIVFFCRIGIAIARALEAVHDAGLLHRDVKPANILLRAQGEAVLTDFGLARDPQAELETRSGTFLGTSAYAAPEQLAGRRAEIDVRSDVYSLGATLYQCFSGELPYGTGSTTELAKRMARMEARPLRKLDRRLPQELDAIIGQAMALEPRRRYGRAGDLAADLDRFLIGQPIAARPPTFWRRIERWTRRRPAMAMLIVLLVLGLLRLAFLGTAFLENQRSALEDERRSRAESLVLEGTQWLPESQFGRAGALFDAALAEDPSSSTARVCRAYVHLRSGENEALLTLLATPESGLQGRAGFARLRRAALERLGRDAEAATIDAAGLEARDGIDHLVEGLLAFGATRLRGADERSAIFRTFDISQSLGDADGLALLLQLLRCQAAGEAENVDVVLSSAEALRKRWPRCAAAHYRAGVELRKLKRPAEAVVALREAVALQPTSALAQNGLGNALQDVGELVAAEQAFDAAIRLAPEYADAHFNRANLLESSGRTAEAIDGYALALGHYPEHSRALLNQSQLLQRTGRLGEAVEHAREAARLNPSLFDYQWNLATKLDASQAAPAEVLAATAKAIVLHPSHCDCAFLHGRTLLRLGQHREAARELDRARAVCEAEGRWKQSREFLRQLAKVRRMIEVVASRRAVPSDVPLRLTLFCAASELGAFRDALQLAASITKLPYR